MGHEESAGEIWMVKGDRVAGEMAQGPRVWTKLQRGEVWFPSPTSGSPSSTRASDTLFWILRVSSRTSTNICQHIPTYRHTHACTCHFWLFFKKAMRNKILSPWTFKSTYSGCCPPANEVIWVCSTQWPEVMGCALLLCEACSSHPQRPVWHLSEFTSFQVATVVITVQITLSPISMRNCGKVPLTFPRGFQGIPKEHLPIASHH